MIGSIKKKNFTAYSFKYILSNKKMKLPVNRNSVQAFLPNQTLKDHIYESEHHNGHCHATKYKKTGLAYRKPAEFFYAHTNILPLI